VPRDVAAGLTLIAIGAFAVLSTGELPLGTARQIGPGMFPRALAWLLVAIGALVALAGLRARGGQGWQPTRPRGVFFVTLAIGLFALTVRGVDLGGVAFPALGLVVAAPLAILVAGVGSHETRRGEILVFAVAMTALAVVLFKVLLGLPIPLAPWLLGY
jgi:putative tricarboxylic transport membrane protein